MSRWGSQPKEKSKAGGWQARGLQRPRPTPIGVQAFAAASPAFTKALGPPPGLRQAGVTEQCIVASPVRDTSVPSPSLCHTESTDQLAAASDAPDASDPSSSLSHADALISSPGLCHAEARVSDESRPSFMLTAEFLCMKPLCVVRTVSLWDCGDLPRWP